MGWFIVLAICTGAIALYRWGRIDPHTARVECPLCREAIRPSAIIYPHCQADLMRGPGAPAMRAARADLLRRHRGQQSFDRLLAAILVAGLLAAILYVYLSPR